MSSALVTPAVCHETRLKSPASLSEVFGEKAQSRSQSSFVTASRGHTDTQHDGLAEWAVFFVVLVFVTLSCLHVGAPPLMLIRTSKTDETDETDVTDTDKTAPPRDTEKTVKSDATETKDTKLLHEKFLTRKIQCDEFCQMFHVVFHPIGHPTSKMHTLKQSQITLQTHPHPTSDSQFLHEFQFFNTYFSFLSTTIVVSCVFSLIFGPLMHEKLLF